MFSVVASAGVTSKVTIKTYKQFDEGEANNAVITSIGEVKPGWVTAKQELEFEGGVWSALALPGGTVLLGTAQKGEIFISRKGTTSKLTSIPDVLAVVSMARGKDGNVYVGTMPKAQVLRVNPNKGKTTKVATLKDADTVWSLTT